MVLTCYRMHQQVRTIPVLTCYCNSRFASSGSSSLRYAAPIQFRWLCDIFSLPTPHCQKLQQSLQIPASNSHNKSNNQSNITVEVSRKCGNIHKKASVLKPFVNAYTDFHARHNCNLSQCTHVPRRARASCSIIYMTGSDFQLEQNFLSPFFPNVLPAVHAKFYLVVNCSQFCSRYVSRQVQSSNPNYVRHIQIVFFALDCLFFCPLLSNSY